MITNKLYSINGRHYLIHAGDVYLAEQNKPLRWMKWNPQYVKANGTVVGQNYKPKQTDRKVFR